jgi:transglutaminase-like putative cysteine protease
LNGLDLPEEPMARARAFYDIVDRHMKYDKPAGKPWGRGDAVWACDSRYGNCTDFHSLFISLARSYKIPAKFEMGFSIPEKQGKGEVQGYHCWAKFRPSERGWVAVDISEANKDPKMKDYYFGNLTADRVAVTTGRDIDLVPQQKGKALNYFIFPYAEVEGKPVPAEKITRKNSYEDVK